MSLKDPAPQPEARLRISLLTPASPRLSRFWVWLVSPEHRGLWTELGKQGHHLWVSTATVDEDTEPRGAAAPRGQGPRLGRGAGVSTLGTATMPGTMGSGSVWEEDGAPYFQMRKNHCVWSP